MPIVAVIDDREDVRKRLARRISRKFLKRDVQWEVKDYEPLPKIEQYPNWIVTEKVVLLVVDEKLGELEYRAYDGHDLVGEIRKSNKQLPIYVVTSYADTDALKSMKGDFEDVVDRDTFNDETEQYISRFIRATQQYLTIYQEEYKRLAKLSESVALGQASAKDLDELNALRTKLELPVSGFQNISRAEWINSLDTKTKQLEELAREISELLNKGKHK